MIRAGAFNPDDLMFNQIGDLSPRQRRWLKLEMAGWACQIMFNLILLVAAWVAFYLQFQFTTYFFLGGALWSILIVGSTGISLQSIWPIWKSLKDNEVQSVAGTISKRYTFQRPNGRWSGSSSWALIIRSDSFGTSPRIFDAITEQQSYRLFYIPALQRPVNIEPLFSEDQQKKSALAKLQAQAKEKELSDE